MVYAINFDWMDELDNNRDNWENLGRDVLDNSCSCHDESEDDTNVGYQGYCENCDISEDSAYPMINYAYPLDFCPTDEQILKVVKEACLTVMHKIDTDEYFLVLCGGGMDLSQSIGYAYILCGEDIPLELLKEISMQRCLSVGGEQYKILKSKVIEQLEQESKRNQDLIKNWSVNP